jgi:glyoxylate carboligase
VAQLTGQAPGPDQRGPVHDHTPAHPRAEGEHRHAPLAQAGRPELAQGGGVTVVLDDDRHLEPTAQLGAELVVPGGEVGPPDEMLAVGR